MGHIPLNFQSPVAADFICRIKILSPFFKNEFVVTDKTYQNRSAEYAFAETFGKSWQKKHG